MLQLLDEALHLVNVWRHCVSFSFGFAFPGPAEPGEFASRSARAGASEPQAKRPASRVHPPWRLESMLDVMMSYRPRPRSLKCSCKAASAG